MPEFQEELVGVRVFAGVAQSFLGNPEERGLHGDRQALLPQLLRVVYVPAAIPETFYLQANSSGKTEVVERGRAEVRDNAPGLANGLLHEFQGLAEFLPALFRIGG